MMEKSASSSRSSYPYISVIIPAFNSEKEIGECLNAAINAPPTEKEIIVIDDASTDSTSKIVSQFPVKLIRRTNRSGPALARNEGVAQSTGEIVAFIDSDCVIEKDSLEILLRALTENHRENIGGVGAVAKPVEETLISNSYSVRLFGTSPLTETRIREIDSIGSAFAMYPRKVFTEVGGFDTNLRGGEDYDLNLRIRKAGYKLLLVPSAKTYHRHPTSLSALAKKWFFYGGLIFSVYKKNHLKKDIVMTLGWGSSCILLFFILLWSKELLFLPLLILTFWVPWALYYGVSTVKFWIYTKRIDSLAMPIIHQITIVSYTLGFVFAIFKASLKKKPSKSQKGWKR